MIATTATFQTSKKPTASQRSRLQSARTSFLRRKCACGGTAGPTGECEDCREKRLQRKASAPQFVNQTGVMALPIVHEVLRSPGQPLGAATRPFMESCFGHDFSGVRIHSRGAEVMQRKLNIRASDDPLEREAEQVSDQVLMAPAHFPATGQPLNIQRYAGQATEGTDAAPPSVD